MPFHAADHVKGGFGLSAQGHLQQVVLDARFDGFAQLRGDLKEAVGRTKTFDALMRPLVVVVFDPKADAFPGRIEALELGAGEELLPDRFPEALNLAQRHRVMRAGLEVSDAAFFEFGLEAGGAPPGGVLAPVVGEHFFGRVILAHGGAQDFQHVLGCLAAEDISADQEARVIVHEPDQVGVTATQPEGEDVRLPHLIGCGPFEEARTNQIAPRLGRRLNQIFLVECLAHCLGAGLQKEYPPQQLGDALDPPRGFFFLEFEDFVPDRGWQLRAASAATLALQAGFAIEPVKPRPLIHSSAADTQLLADELLSEAFFQVKLNRPQSLLETARRNFSRRSPPRGGGVLVLLLYRFILLHLTLPYH